jgi:AbrB family looped-hinge helix DNA binding protein
VPNAKVTSKGQITVPKEVREKLGLEPGDELEFIEQDGQFIIRLHFEHSPFESYVGYLEHLRGKRPDDLVDEMRGEP